MAEFGSFGGAIPGGVEAVTAALQRRRFGDKVSPLQQVSGGAPGAGLMPAATPTMAREPSAMPAGVRSRPTGVGQAETEIIVKALAKRLAALSQMMQGLMETAQTGGGGQVAEALSLPGKLAQQPLSQTASVALGGGPPPQNIFTQPGRGQFAQGLTDSIRAALQRREAR